MSATATTEDFPGTLNFRAVAACPATGGRLRGDTLWRSGAFDDIAAPGLERMRARGITRVFDLRSDTEKGRRPSPLLDRPGFTVMSEAHDIRSGDLAAVLAAPGATPEDCAGVMRAVYGRLPQEFSGIFRRYIRALLEDERAVAVHCTAGKDRTGVAIALVLDLLGVSRDDIVADYLRTNAVRALLRERLQSRNQGVDFGEVRTDLLEPVIAADETYLAAMFAALDDRHGGIARYAETALALSPAEIDALRARLVD
ncbi:tyrosine-protein phosphatase [Salipiger sp.]|uniref:tyrosine-protein phosphatase n=1 Tax=Salipiger sp. TaxID=2078585 RepID=UPI003A974585